MDPRGQYRGFKERKLFLKSPCRSAKWTVSRLEGDKSLKESLKYYLIMVRFIDLGGVDGLLHVTKILHGIGLIILLRVPFDSQPLKVQIIPLLIPEINLSSLGMKQLENDPWAGADLKWHISWDRNTGKSPLISPIMVHLLSYRPESIEGTRSCDWNRLDKEKYTSKEKLFLQVKELTSWFLISVMHQSAELALVWNNVSPNPWAALKRDIPLAQRWRWDQRTLQIRPFESDFQKILMAQFICRTFLGIKKPGEAIQ